MDALELSNLRGTLEIEKSKVLKRVFLGIRDQEELRDINGNLDVITNYLATREELPKNDLGLDISFLRSQRKCV